MRLDTRGISTGDAMDIFIDATSPGPWTTSPRRAREPETQDLLKSPSNRKLLEGGWRKGERGVYHATSRNVRIFTSTHAGSLRDGV